MGHDEGWALKVLGFKPDAEPTRTDILTMFRQLVRPRPSRPRRGERRAGQRITELTQAKRILLAEI